MFVSSVDVCRLAHVSVLTSSVQTVMIDQSTLDCSTELAVKLNANL